ncbi:hypothetical protein [Galbibacter mesophilus]|uniref:hypothetical protein n=1 Tax=Galbibacter mesophilus TaxID=379069 RepID=UPI00191E507F|nr:hypothetical protein [Galbibacter mesophilus]MCM5663361.1 hypothetical protein [Galbibacter mesophilus]
MKSDNQIFSLSTGYGPFISEGTTALLYCFPVTSGHIDKLFEFGISEIDFAILKSNNYKFKALYYILFHEIQSTFGTGHPSPRKYTNKEFEYVKNRVLHISNSELELYIKEFSRDKNLSEDYFQLFSKNLFLE